MCIARVLNLKWCKKPCYTVHLSCATTGKNQFELVTASLNHVLPMQNGGTPWPLCWNFLLSARWFLNNISSTTRCCRPFQCSHITLISYYSLNILAVFGNIITYLTLEFIQWTNILILPLFHLLKICQICQKGIRQIWWENCSYYLTNCWINIFLFNTLFHSHNCWNYKSFLLFLGKFDKFDRCNIGNIQSFQPLWIQ